MYVFSDEDHNHTQFFRFNKKLVKSMTWAMLPLSAKAVLPVIYSYTNEKGQAWPSETTISALSGVSCKTVRSGINALLTLPGFSFDWQMTAQGRKSKKFKVPIATGNEVFFFFKQVLTGGHWRLLKPVGKAVYPVLRTFSAWDKEEAEEEEEGILDEADNDYREAYAKRDYDISEMMPGDIAKFSGINRQRVFPALRDLQERELIKRDGVRWKVFLRSPIFYKRAFLNEQLMKSFAHKKRGEDE